MMKHSPLLVLGIIISFTAYSQSFPGGISGNLRWWLKADAGTFTGNGTGATVDGSLVQQWNDQSLVGNHARQVTNANKPVYKTNIINGYPVLRFATDQFIDGLATPAVGPTDNLQMFLVLRQNAYTPGGTNDGSGTFIIDRTTATNNLMSFKMVNTDKYYYQKRNDTGGSLTGPVSVTGAQVGTFVLLEYYRTVGTAYGIYINGRLDATSGGDSENITGPQLRIGRHATTTGGGLNGDLAELALYNNNPNAGNRLKIESYLALKYGITLDQTTATNYVNSNLTTIYPATTTHDLYDQNIAGIGRDDASGLNQTSSQSQNSQSIVRIFNPSDLQNNEFLVWGNDAPVIWNSSDVPAGYTNRISRIWRVAETGGDVGTFSISFDLTGLNIDTSDPTKFALLIDGNGVFSDATAYTTGRSIVGNLVTFTGANLANNNYFSLAANFIPGPGGVAATTAWVRADEEVYTDAGVTLATNGQSVQQWNTKNGVTAAKATQSTAGNKPTYQTNIINGNPVIRFSFDDFLDFGNLGVTTTSDLSMFMAFRPALTAGGTLTDNTGRYAFDRTTSTTPRVSLKMLSTGKVGFQESTDAGPTDGVSTTTSVSTTLMQIVDFYRDYGVRFGIYYNGAQEGTLSEAGGALTFPNPRIGATASGGSSNGLSGDVAEFIFYNRDITAAERNRIDSYMAIKYGITLDQNASLQNYTASDAVVVFPATSSHSGYNSDIAGIGKDAVSRLSQSSSKSINANAVVTVSSPSSLDDMDYFIWGDNAGSMTTGSTSDVDGTVIQRRLARVWRAAERGDVGNISISFDLTNVPGAKAQADLRLMVDRDGDGFADNDVTPITGTLAGQIFTVASVNLQNNDYFTVGTVNAVTTPLPIQLTDFKVSIQNDGVLANWTTHHEINNDYFTLETSLDGEDFDDVMRVPGAGTTNDAQYYEVLDHPRTVGDIYYRLKQTDYDGKRWYSSVRKVTLAKSPFFVRMYPNPIERGEVNIELPGDSYNSTIELLNASGVVVFTGTTDQTTTSLDISDLPKGIYFVRVVTNEGAKALKLVIR